MIEHFDSGLHTRVGKRRSATERIRERRVNDLNDCLPEGDLKHKMKKINELYRALPTRSRPRHFAEGARAVSTFPGTDDLAC